MAVGLGMSHQFSHSLTDMEIVCGNLFPSGVSLAPRLFGSMNISLDQLSL